MSRIKNRDLFENAPVAKAVSTMAIPSIIGQLIVLIYNMADTFFIGRTNNPFMVAGASLILPVFNISLSISAIASIGGGALISRLYGKREDTEAKRVFSFCVIFSCMAAFVFSSLMFAFMDPILRLLGAGENTYGYAKSYAMCVIVAGAMPTILSNVLANLVRSVGESSKAGIGITIGGVLNIILDPIFMFVLMPRGMEIVGAGVATCVSNCISCLYFIIVIKKMGSDSILGMVPAKEAPTKQSLKEIFATGIPSAMATLLFDITYIIMDKLIASYGDIALAAIGIVLKAERLPLNAGIGICQGMVPIVAYNYAAKNYKRMQEIKRFSLLCGVAVALGSLVLYEIFAPYIMRFFISDAQTVALGTNFLRIRCIATVLMFTSFYHVHLFNGYGAGRHALLLGVTRWLAFNIPVMLLLNHFFGMYGIIWTQFTGDIFTVLLSLILHKKYADRHFN